MDKKFVKVTSWQGVINSGIDVFESPVEHVLQTAETLEKQIPQRLNTL
jgi:hypothetical protein